MRSIPRKMRPGERLTADDYNALLDYVRSIRPIAGANTSIDYFPTGSVIHSKYTPSDDGPLPPFAVRWHEQDDGGNGQWEIYMPDACVTVGASCLTINRRANLTSGHGDGGLEDSEDWYVLPLDESGGSARDKDGMSVREFDIVVHVKEFAWRDGVDELGSSPRRVCYAAAHKRTVGNETQTDEERAKYRWGDGYERTVGVVTVELSKKDGKTYRSYNHIAKTPIDVQGRVRSNFELVYVLNVDDEGELSESHVYCTATDLTVAGRTVSGQTLADVKGAETVWVRVVFENGVNTLSIMTDLSSPSESDDVVDMKIYDIDHDVVSTDLRANNLQPNVYA